MKRITTELKVGLFVLAAIAIVVGSFFWSFDGVTPNEDSYTLVMTTQSAEGLYEGSKIKVAGVEVGAVDDIQIRGDRAQITLRIRSQYELPLDSSAELKASGLLGDYFVAVYPGTEGSLLADGDIIETRSEPGNIDEITRNLEEISDDIAAITKILRQVVEKEENVDHVEASLANVDALTEELASIAERNSRDVDAILDSILRLSEALEGHVDDIAADVDDEMDRLKDLTDDLDRAAEDVASITGKVDRGEGTLGALVNDRTTIDEINATVKNANRAVKSFTGLRPEVYYQGRLFFGSQPNDLDTFFYGNPLSGQFSNVVGLRLRSHEDFWYVFEVVDYPQGTINQRQVIREDSGTVETRWIREAKFRFSFQMEKKWGPVSLRLGIKESAGGVGLTAYAWKDRFQFSLDVFDFFFGSYPAIQDSGIPNVRANFRVEPIRHLFFEAGLEQIALGAKYGYVTGYVGLGFYFTDDDVKWVVSGLPVGF